MVRSNLEKIFFEGERAIRMKTKVTWAKQGNANTKLFHNLMNARKAKNVITKLELEDGSFVNKEEDIIREITDFFQSWYEAKGLSFRGIDGIKWQPILPYLADWLQRPFEEEVKKAIFKCDGSRAPGPDGFTLKPFQSQGETMKDDIWKVFPEFERDEIIHVTNETHICFFFIRKKPIVDQ